MPEARVFLDGQARLVVRLNGKNPTFRIDTERISAKLLAPLTPILEDLLEIASTVFAADGSFRRGGPSRPGMGNGWRRNFTFEIPVRDPMFWSSPAVLGALTDAVAFLTDDDVAFRFVQSAAQYGPQAFFQFQDEAAAFAADEVILFSGGLDSFAGALEALATHHRKVVLVSHVSAPKVQKRQEALARCLATRFPGQVLHIPVRATRVGAEAAETTQRSRSFLFASLGQVVARMIGAKEVRFYENGVVGHQLPISSQVVGTMATRTTHPLSLQLLNALMARLAPEPVPIGNPFEWLTKADVLRPIAENGGSGQIAEAASCTSIHNQSNEKSHCGTCTQCLDRRFGILAEKLEAFDPADHYATDVLLGERTAPHSATLAGFWVAHALEKARLDEHAFLARYGQEFARIRRGYPDIPAREIMTRCLDMHRRQGAYVVRVLTEAIALHAGEMAHKQVTRTSLLVTHIADGSLVELQGRISAIDPATALLDAAVGATDEGVWVADGHLDVTFAMDGDVHVVAVKDLGRVTGHPARVAHLLKPAFDEDRAEGRPPSGHRYLESGHLARAAATNKGWVRQNVKRCRGKLAEFYLDLHGSPPPSHVLIEGRQSRGYRLDPGIVLATDPL